VPMWEGWADTQDHVHDQHGSVMTERYTCVLSHQSRRPLMLSPFPQSPNESIPAFSSLYSKHASLNTQGWCGGNGQMDEMVLRHSNAKCTRRTRFSNLTGTLFSFVHSRQLLRCHLERGHACMMPRFPYSTIADCCVQMSEMR
jgi:hypothetical protein